MSSTVSAMARVYAAWLTTSCEPAAASDAHFPAPAVHLQPENCTDDTANRWAWPTIQEAATQPRGAGTGPARSTGPSSLPSAWVSAAASVGVALPTLARQVKPAATSPVNASAITRACASHWAYALGAALCWTAWAASATVMSCHPDTWASRPKNAAAA